MRRLVDLHAHSNASDGMLPPRELIALADRKRLAAVALTDHDTVAGLAEAADEARAHGDLRFVPGIEVSARFTGGTMHILGLGFRADAPALTALIAQLRAARDDRNPKIVARLQALGYPIDMDDVLAVAARGEGGGEGGGEGVPPSRVAGILPAPVPWFAASSAATTFGREKPIRRERRIASDSSVVAANSAANHGTLALSARTIGRVHIAEALRRKRLVGSIAEAFDRLIGLGRPAYVDKERLSPAQVVAVLAESGGAAVLAHPPQLNYGNLAQLERVVRGLVPHGLAAIEAYHTDNSDFQTREYLRLAKRLGIGVTGGSDFHGDAKPNARLGRPAVPLSMIEGRLREILFPGESA